MPAKNVGTADFQDADRAIGFAEACERLDRIDFSNFAVVSLTAVDVKTIRSLLILSGALYEYRDANKKTVKIFRNVAANDNQLAMLTNRPRSIAFLRARRNAVAEQPAQIEPVMEIEQ